jgi:hypothetical protein
VFTNEAIVVFAFLYKPQGGRLLLSSCEHYGPVTNASPLACPLPIAYRKHMPFSGHMHLGGSLGCFA